MKLRKTIAGVGAAAVFAGSVLVAVPALAQDDSAGTTDNTAVAEATNERCHHADLSTIADVLGIDTDELRDRLAAGETVADVAAAEGIAIDDVIAALVSEAEERLDGAVADGRLTQEEADERLAGIEERITDMVNGEISLRGGERFRSGILGLDAVAEVLGMERPDVLDQLRSGSTLSDIAAEQGIAVADVEAAMSAAAAERLQQAVTDGDLTQAEADERLAEIDERIAAVVEGELAIGGNGFERRHGHRDGFGSTPSDTAESSTTDA